MTKVYKWGLFVGEVKVGEYDNKNYAEALKDLNYAYVETGIPHQLKLI